MKGGVGAAVLVGCALLCSLADAHIVSATVSLPHLQAFCARHAGSFTRARAMRARASEEAAADGAEQARAARDSAARGSATFILIGWSSVHRALCSRLARARPVENSKP